MSNPHPNPNKVKPKKKPPGVSPEGSIAQRIKAAKLVKGLLEGKNQQTAAREAGYSETIARTGVYEVIKRPYVQSLLTDAIARAGISLDDLAAVVHQGLSAVKIMNTKLGPIVLQDQPDFDARYGAYDRITQALGLVPHRTEMPGATAPGLVVNITQASPKTIMADGSVEPPPNNEALALNISVRSEST